MADNDEVNTPPDFRPQGIRFDKTVTLGNVMTMLGGIVMMCGAYVDYRLTVDRHDMRILANEVAVHLLQQQVSESIKSQSDMTRAIDRLTFQLQNGKQP